jgi:hypothetical protein
VSLPPERRLSSALLGGIFLGFILMFFGFLPQAGSQQPLPIWVWRTVGWDGALLMISTIPATVSRREWTRLAAIAGLGLTMVPIGLVLVYSLMGGRISPFTLLLLFGVIGCGKGIAFYCSPEIRSCFAPRAAAPQTPDPGGP